MNPNRYPRRILLCVAGLSPQIVTETLYALTVTGELEPLVCAAGMAAWRRRDETGEFIICVNPGEGPLPLPDAAKYGETVFTIGQAGERRLEGQSAVIRRIR